MPMCDNLQVVINSNDPVIMAGQHRQVPTRIIAIIQHMEKCQ